MFVRQVLSDGFLATTFFFMFWVFFFASTNCLPAACGTVSNIVSGTPLTTNNAPLPNLWGSPYAGCVWPHDDFKSSAQRHDGQPLWVPQEGTTGIYRRAVNDDVGATGHDRSGGGGGQRTTFTFPKTGPVRS